MKLISWNVNSLRAAETNFLEFIQEYSPDIVMIQELRAFEDQLSFFLKSLPDYSVHFNPSPRPGMWGTALYYKSDLSDKFELDKLDPMLEEENRVITFSDGDVVMLNIYTPNGSSNEKRQEYKIKFYNKLIEKLEELLQEGKQIVLGGDFNIAHTELDLYNPKGNVKRSGFLPEEREILDKITKLGFKDTFRMFNKEGGNYSWWHLPPEKREFNNGWRFDYFFVSKDLVPRVKNAEILKGVFGSDHCPILLEIELA